MALKVHNFFSLFFSVWPLYCQSDGQLNWELKTQFCYLAETSDFVYEHLFISRPFLIWFCGCLLLFMVKFFLNVGTQLW